LIGDKSVNKPLVFSHDALFCSIAEAIEGYFSSSPNA
jgi:hypothetical protein